MLTNQAQDAVSGSREVGAFSNKILGSLALTFGQSVLAGDLCSPLWLQGQGSAFS